MMNCRDILGWVLCMVLLLSSCGKEKHTSVGDSFLLWGTVQETEERFSFLSDTSSTLWVANNLASAPAYLKKGDRVVITCFATSQTFFENEIFVKINGVKKINVIPLSCASSPLPDSIPNDTLPLVSLWKSGKWINLHLKMEYFNSPHYVHLFADTNKINSDTLFFELRYGRRNDPRGTLLDEYISFEVDSLSSLYPQAVISILLTTPKKGKHNFTLTNKSSFR